ncbi:MAG: YdcF family protein [Verrucomicrobia bacterium]|nr:YdcF family protein [Verrucomicrobiota bacterium]
MRRWLKRCVLGGIVGAAVWCAVLAFLIRDFGSRDHAVKSDCAIVLGAAVDGNAPSPVFEERIRHAINLYQAGFAGKLVFTGGTGEGQSHSEGSVARAYAIRHGVPAGDILIEEDSRTTCQNLTEARRLMRGNGLVSAILVSDPLHMRRAMLMAGNLGIKAVSSPTPTSRYRSAGTRAVFLAREIYFHHHYLVTGE